MKFATTAVCPYGRGSATMPDAVRTHDLMPSAPTSRRAESSRAAPPSGASVRRASSGRQVNPTNGAPPITVTPAAKTPGRSAARSVRSSAIHASARSPRSKAENESVAPASPATRMASTGATRSPGSRCHAPSARRNVALPGLTA